MASGSRPDPGATSDPRRPVRTAGFDGLSTAEPEPERVAGLERLGDAGAPPPRVAAFDALDAPRAGPAPVVSLDALTGRPGGRPVPGGRVEDRPPGEGRSTDGRPTRGSPTDGRLTEGRPARADTTGGDQSDDGLPPDAPLPRGRRRRARVGRLGPDAPDPDLPEPAADPVAAAREICLRLLTDRARTRQELAQALARKGVPDEAAATVLDRFDEVGLIDDAAFAGQWVRSRHAHRGLGRRAIAVELRRKGVADDVAGEALGEVDAEAEAGRARELVDRRLRSLPVGTAEERAGTARRLVGMLARKGYGPGTAYGVVREALAECGADVDELGAESTD